MSADEPAASREDLLALIAVLREQNMARAQRCADLEEHNERLTAGVVKLERPLSHDSNNSCTPPSSDVFSGPPDAAVKPKATRKRGRQLGAPRTGLAIAEAPDRVGDHRPSVCGDRGETLSGAASQRSCRRQDDRHSAGHGADHRAPVA